MCRTALLQSRSISLAGLAWLFYFNASGQSFRGVNVSQAEWGDPRVSTYGSGYSYPMAPTFNYFASRALGFVRLQVQWERLQPVLGGPLDPTNLQWLRQDIEYAKAAGASISIVPHNQARYAPTAILTANPCIIDNPCPGSVINVTADDLADFWVKISTEFKDEPAVAAYDLMNEPHDMGAADWRTIAQTVVTAIRANGDSKLIMIPGDGWSSATYWSSNNGSTAFISDPANHYYYEAHEYFDHDFSGTYAESYDQELAANTQLAEVGVARLLPFVTWCTNNNVPCYLGEYGIPNNDARWLTVLDNFLVALDSAGMPGSYWAAGELWAGVPGCGCSLLSIQPSGDFSTDAEQVPTLLAHPAAGSFRSASAAGSYGWAAAPGQLMAGYGNGLATGAQAADLPWTTSLLDTQVQLTDSTGAVTLAPLLYVSGQQINYYIPAGVASGLASVQVLSGNDPVAAGVLQVQSTAPTLFTANYTGKGVAAAQIQRVHPDGTSEYENVAVYDGASSQFVASPIAFHGDRLFLLLYGTGFDAATGAAGTEVTASGTRLAVTYSGKQPQFAGEDQIDAELPSTLAGAGEVTIAVSVDGKPANPVTITLQ